MMIPPPPHVLWLFIAVAYAGLLLSQFVAR